MTKWIYGKQQVMACVKAGANIQKVFCTPSAKEVIVFLKNHKVFYKLRKAEELTQICGTPKHQNVIALVSEIKFKNLNDIVEKNLNANQLILMLDRIQDVQNYGSILRSAEVFGVDAVIVLNKEQAPITPAVVKTSAGAVSYLNMIQTSNLNNTIHYLKKQGFIVFSTGFNERSQKLSEIKNDFFQGKICLILGNEGSGVSKLVETNSDFIISIDMLGKTESLNVSVACGICLYYIKIFSKIRS